FIVDVIQIIRHYFGFFIYSYCSLKKIPYIGGYCFAQQDFLRGRHEDIALELNKYIKKIKKNNANYKFNILEIGSYAGGSCIQISKTLEANNCEYQIHCCDKWTGYELKEDIGKFNPKKTVQAQTSGKIFEIFIENILYQKIFNKVTLHIGNSKKILPNLIKKKILFDFIYIDGNHSFEYVNQDIHNSKSLILNNGIIMGDDYELKYEAHDKVIIDEAIENDIDFTMDKKNTKAFHPGVTKAVNINFGSINNKNGQFCVVKDNKKFTSIY
ncbi:class I SAM-dependent methyltransferase, partial [Alphaproteobacteria bacterium]|nr:class I SAM-dependent methyltransferase [Alphaproteobacteria bacterium]